MKPKTLQIKAQHAGVIIVFLWLATAFMTFETLGS